MFNIEQELEISGGGYTPGQLEPYDPMIDGEKILVRTRRDGRDYGDYRDWVFCAKTGVHWDQRHLNNPLRLRPKSKTRPVTNYFLFVGQSDWKKDEWVRVDSEVFGEGRAAAERMKYHNGLFSSSMSPFRTMVKPETKLSEVRDYPSWAEFRFSTGEWQKLPWADEPWANKHPEHYAHNSIADPCQIAYYATEAEAQMDVVTTLSPGRYLTTYYSDVLSSTEIQQWAVKVDVECDLKFATTPEEIVEIYSHPNSPASCMRYSDDSGQWRGGPNPTFIYGAGDLAIAYLERRGKIVARGLCWPEKKVYGRIYGDVDRMTMRLDAEGYTCDVSSHNMEGRGNGGFNGARLLRVVSDNYPDYYIMPYIDSGYGVKQHPTDSNLFVLTYASGDVPCTYTNGLSGDPDEDCDYDYYCEACATGIPEGDDYYIEGWGHYCYVCYEPRARQCYHCDCSYHRDDVIYVDDEPYCRRCHDEHTFSCDRCEERTSSPLTPVYNATYAADETPSDVEFEACDYCVDSDADIQRDTNGHTIHAETATQCEQETCGAYFSGDLSPNQCPNCQQAANDTQTQEMEAA